MRLRIIGIVSICFFVLFCGMNSFFFNTYNAEVKNNDEISYSKITEKQILKEEISPQLDSEVTLSLTSTYVSGHLEWMPSDDSGIQPLPLRFIKVILWDGYVGFSAIGVTYTDENGYFSFGFQTGNDLYISYCTESYTICVGPEWGSSNYSKVVDPILENMSMTTFYDCVDYDVTNNTNKAFYVCQGMVIAQRFVQDVMGIDMNKMLHVAYPGWAKAGDWGFSYDWVCGISTDAFDNWRILIHEYGHFVQMKLDTLGISLNDYLFIGMDHNYYEDLIIRYYNDKGHAMKLAWTESWATAFAYIVDDHYSSEYLGVSFNMHPFLPTNPDRGEGQEMTVVDTLVEIFRTTLSYDYEEWWAMTTVSGTYTLTDFCNIIDTEYPHYRSEIGKIMGEHKIAPSDIDVINASELTLSSSTSVSWDMNGSTNNPNNQFKIMFYDEEHNLLGSTDYIERSGTGFSGYHYIPVNIWQDATSDISGKTTINIAIAGYNKKNGVWSGPYISEYYPITIYPYYTNTGGLADNYIEITGTSQLFGTAHIPETLYGRTIYGINSYAFEDQTGITSIIIYSDTMRIRNYAFENCTNLKSVDISDDLTSIGLQPFKGCTRLYGYVIYQTDTMHRMVNSYGNIIIDNHYLSHEGTPYDHHIECLVCGYEDHCDDYAHLTGHNDTTHTYECDSCGYTETEDHNFDLLQTCWDCNYHSSLPHSHKYTHHYIPATPGKFGNQHKAYCACGTYRTMACMGELSLYPPYDTYCGLCGQLMTGGGIFFSITLPNGKTYISDEMFSYDMILHLTEDIGISYSYSDYISYISNTNNDSHSNNPPYYLPSRYNELDEFLN